MTRLVAAAVSVCVLVSITAGCGSGSSDRLAVRPNAVPVELVPPTLQGDLTLTEYLPGRKAFADTGVASLVTDGRVWAIRRGETLVGTLQVSAVKHDISLVSSKDRRKIVDGVMRGTSFETIDIGDMVVSATTTADRNMYLWFGDTVFEVLQLKGTKVDPDSVASDVIDYQLSSGKLKTGASGSGSAGGSGR